MYCAFGPETTIDQCVKSLELVQLLPWPCRMSVVRWPLPTPGAKIPVPAAAEVSVHSL